MKVYVNVEDDKATAYIDKHDPIWNEDPVGIVVMTPDHCARKYVPVSELSKREYETYLAVVKLADASSPQEAIEYVRKTMGKE